jgi:pimeloyl-ACP methyl ester carboxylesterase
MTVPQQTPLERLAATGDRLQTACGDGIPMVWSRWGDGPAVFLLHGGSGSWTHWVRNIDALVAAGRTVYAADLPGCGDSGLPRGAVDADSIHAHVAAGIAAIAGDAPVDLVGFSFGSLVSGLIAADFPERVARLTLTAPPGFGLQEPKLGLRGIPVGADTAMREEVARHNLARLMIHDPTRIDATAVTLHDSNIARDRLRLRKLARTDVMQRLKPRWRAPVHVIWGGNDILLAHAPARLESLFEGCDLRSLAIIPDAGHWVQYEQRRAYDRALAAALAAPLGKLE